MDIDKSKRVLRKIQALTENLEDQGSVSGLERDLLLSYIRDLYEAVSATESTLHEEVSRKVPQPEVAVKDSGPQPEAEQIEPPQESVSSLPQTPTTEPVTNGKTEEVVEDQPEPVEPPAPMPVAVETSNTRTADSGRFRALFETKSSGDLVDKLQTQAISTIQGALGINERLLTINQLFGGDAKAFDETVAHLNGLDSFSSAREYLVAGAASRYGWDSEEKVDRAASFIQVVRRKYL